MATILFKKMRLEEGCSNLSAPQVLHREDVMMIFLVLGSNYYVSVPVVHLIKLPLLLHSFYGVLKFYCTSYVFHAFYTRVFSPLK